MKGLFHDPNKAPLCDHERIISWSCKAPL